MALRRPDTVAEKEDCARAFPDAIAMGKNGGGDVETAVTRENAECSLPSFRAEHRALAPFRATEALMGTRVLAVPWASGRRRDDGTAGAKPTVSHASAFSLARPDAGSSCAVEGGAAMPPTSSALDALKAARRAGRVAERGQQAGSAPGQGLAQLQTRTRRFTAAAAERQRVALWVT